VSGERAVPAWPSLDLAALLDGSPVSASRAVTRVRDLILMRGGVVVLVVACDSNAAIGAKPGDALAQDPRETGYSAAKVPLMEVVAAGARPVLLVDNLCCELRPSGELLLDGIRRAIADAGVDVVVTGSDETNMPTVQTGLGVTVIGVAGPDELRIGTARPGDVVWCVGAPRDGLDVPFADGTPGIAGTREVRAALDLAAVHEVLPVGSRGIRYEAEQLAATAGLRFSPATRSAVALGASAGPSTCFLAAGTATAGEQLANAVVPCNVAGVGTLVC
jgi:hypothetical protein